MSIVAKPYIFVNGAVIQAAEHNANFDGVYNNVNGNLDNTNVKANAGIVDSKLAQITTASKVSGAALTLLANIPAGAGVIPVANLPTTSFILGDASINPTNIVSNGDVEVWSAGTDAAPDGFVIYGTTPTLARDTGDTGYGSYSAKITAAGSTLQGLTYTLTGLRASTTYSVSYRTKVTSGDTSQVKTTGAETNLTVTESTSTTFVTKTGTFITDASATNVVLYLLAKADTDVVWFDGIQVNQGASAFAFSPRPVTEGFGAWVDKSASYGAQQATTDGFVLAYTNHDDEDQSLEGYTDSSSNPTTIRIASGTNAEASSAGQVSIMFPVRKYDYWKVTSRVGSTITAVYWLPTGS